MEGRGVDLALPNGNARARCAVEWNVIFDNYLGDLTPVRGQTSLSRIVAA
jgi:hypothetical protein